MLAHVMGQTVSTSGPAPGVFADVYDELASRGFCMWSVHLSDELSGTVGRHAPVPPEPPGF